MLNYVPDNVTTDDAHGEYLYKCSVAGYDVRLDNIPVTIDDAQDTDSAIDNSALLIV